eukprot:15352685-Ditylum_brightwellii.AAC.1
MKSTKYDNSSTEVQWRNAANCQNGIALLVLDPKLEGYEISKLYQWKMCVQLSARGASSNMPVAEIGNKVKHLLLKLEEIRGTNTLTMCSKKEKRIQVAMFPKTANNVKMLLNYDVKGRRNKNILFLFHVMSTVPLYTFKKDIFT